MVSMDCPKRGYSHRVSGILLLWVGSLAVLTSCASIPKQPIPVDVPPVNLPYIEGRTELPLYAVFIDNRLSVWTYETARMLFGSARRREPPVRIRVIVAVWSSGRIVWSEDVINGGPPYKTGRVRMTRLKEFLRSIESEGLFEDMGLRLSHTSPDSVYTSVVVRDGPKYLAMHSEHELWEARPEFVGTSRGIEVLEGRNREDVWDEWAADYMLFRWFWEEVKEGMLSLIPEDGRIEKDIVFDLYVHP